MAMSVRTTKLRGYDKRASHILTMDRVLAVLFVCGLMAYSTHSVVAVVSRMGYKGLDRFYPHEILTDAELDVYIWNSFWDAAMYWIACGTQLLSLRFLSKMTTAATREEKKTAAGRYITLSLAYTLIGIYAYCVNGLFGSMAVLLGYRILTLVVVWGFIDNQVIDQLDDAMELGECNRGTTQDGADEDSKKDEDDHQSPPPLPSFSAVDETMC